jgi:hypothetical protein
MNAYHRVGKVVFFPGDVNVSVNLDQPWWKLSCHFNQYNRTKTTFVPRVFEKNAGKSESKRKPKQ